jgi:hypothetical protein
MQFRDVDHYDSFIRLASAQFFRESDLIVMNFGVWYYEQAPTGVKTNHTPDSYIRHMLAVADAIALHRQPHQLIVWRESTGPRRYNYEAIKTANLLLRPYMAQRQISVIYDHSTKFGATGPQSDDPWPSCTWITFIFVNRPCK